MLEVEFYNFVMSNRSKRVVYKAMALEGLARSDCGRSGSKARHDPIVDGRKTIACRIYSAVLLAELYGVEIGRESVGLRRGEACDGDSF